MGTTNWRDTWNVVGDLPGGGHGHTHKVQRRGQINDAVYVLKTLKDQSSPERRARLRAEAVALETIDHPHIARLVDTNSDQYGDLSVKLYIVTEYIDGKPMSGLELPVPVEDACASLDSILITLSFCHQRGHLHRDLKPDNVSLRDGNVRDPVIIDFGQTFNSDNPIEGFETETGQQLGNRFMHLPELMTSGADKRNALSDISFCVGLLFFLLTGQKPEALRDHQQRRPDERDLARQILSRLPEWQRRQLNRIFGVGFSQEFEQRWQSIEELRKEIARLTDANLSTEARPFREQLKSIKEAMLDNPEHAIRNQLAQVHTMFAGSVQNSIKVLQTELQPTIQVGNSGPSFNPSTGRGSVRIQFRHTQYGATFLLDVTWERVRGQLILLGEPSTAQGLFGTRNDARKKFEVSKFSLSDPELVSSLHASFESFIAEQLQTWLDSLSRGSSEQA